MWNGFASTELSLLLSRGGQKPGDCVTQQMGAEQRTVSMCSIFKSFVGMGGGKGGPPEEADIRMHMADSLCRQQKLTS